MSKFNPGDIITLNRAMLWEYGFFPGLKGMEKQLHTVVSHEEYQRKFPQGHKGPPVPEHVYFKKPDGEYGYDPERFYVLATLEINQKLLKKAMGIKD